MTAEAYLLVGKWEEGFMGGAIMVCGGYEWMDGVFMIGEVVMVRGGYVGFLWARALNFARIGAELLERGLIPWMVG